MGVCYFLYPLIAKVFNFDEYFSFISGAFGTLRFCLKQGLKDTLLFSSKSFVVLALTFRSIVSFCQEWKVGFQLPIFAVDISIIC